jgi:Zn-dependent protease
MDSQPLLERALMLIPLVLSLTVHEFAHAWSARLLGDDTAERMGRFTLNPLVHIDLFGTLLLPLLGIPFGWAKPVPVDPSRFRRDVSMRTGWMLTAAAGPLSNIVLAALSALAFALTFRFAPGFLPANPGFEFFLKIMVVANVGLALFNLLPVPPLDGSGAVPLLLNDRATTKYQEFIWGNPAVAWIGLFVAWQFFGDVFQPLFIGAVSLLYPGVSYQ